MRPGDGSFDSGTTSAIATTPTSTNGTLIRKTEPHQKFSSRSPPVTGPIAMPMPEKLAQMPIALPRSDGSNTFVITDSVCGCTSAAPMPISARVPISWPGVDANAEATDANPNRIMPTIRKRRRP